jgi:hypothetical protein
MATTNRRRFCVELGRRLATQEAPVLVSFSYVLLRWLLELIALRVRSSELKELEIVGLRHEVAMLRRNGGMR